MSFNASPPHFFVTSHRDLIRGQIPIKIIMPLVRYLRFQRQQVVESGQNTPAGAIRAFRTVERPGSYRCTPLMALRTLPPHVLIAIHRYLLRSRPPVAGRMPLRSKLRTHPKQIISTWYLSHIWSQAGSASQICSSCPRSTCCA